MQALLQALVVANSHLAKFTQHYKLHFQLRGNASQQLTIQASMPIHADLFEAYVGALFQEQGLNPVYSFLSQALSPSISLAYEVVKGNYIEGFVASTQARLVFSSYAGGSDIPPAPLMAHPLPFTDESGCTSLLNQHFTQQHKHLDWEFSPPGGSASAPVWEVKAVERGGSVLATATGATKKTAKNIAARRALIALGVLQAPSTPQIGTENA
ncbi:Ribonuclease III, partial [Rhizoctonia solani]